MDDWINKLKRLRKNSVLQNVSETDTLKISGK